MVATSGHDHRAGTRCCRACCPTHMPHASHHTVAYANSPHALYLCRRVRLLLYRLTLACAVPCARGHTWPYRTSPYRAWARPANLAVTSVLDDATLMPPLTNAMSLQRAGPSRHR